MKSLKARIVSKSPSQEDCLYKKDTTFKTHMDKNKSISRFQLSKMFQSSVEKAEETESQVKKAQRKKLSKTKSEANRKFLKAISTDKASKISRNMVIQPSFGLECCQNGKKLTKNFQNF